MDTGIKGTWNGVVIGTDSNAETADYLHQDSL